MREYFRAIVPLGIFGMVAGLFIGILHSSLSGFSGDKSIHDFEPELRMLMSAGSAAKECGTSGKSFRQWTVNRDSLKIAEIFALKVGDRRDSVAFIACVDTAGTILGFRWYGTQITPLIAATMVQSDRKIMIWEILKKQPVQGPSLFELQFNGISILRPVNIHLVHEWPRLNDADKEALRQGNIVYTLDGHGESTQRIIAALSAIVGATFREKGKT